MLCTLKRVSLITLYFHFQCCDIRNLIAHAHKKGGVEVGEWASGPFLDRAAHVTASAPHQRWAGVLLDLWPSLPKDLLSGPVGACGARVTRWVGVESRRILRGRRNEIIACDACMLYSRPQQSWLIGLQQRQEGDPRAYTSQRNATHVSAKALSCVILSTLRLSLP